MLKSGCLIRQQRRCNMSPYFTSDFIVHSADYLFKAGNGGGKVMPTGHCHNGDDIIFRKNMGGKMNT